MMPPITAPMLHTAWKELRIDRPYSRWTLSPWEFWATSVIASIAPATKSAAASTAQTDAAPAPTNPTVATRVAPTATRAEPNRRMSAPADSPATSAPSGKAATAAPKEPFDRSSPALISGYLGSRLAKSAPLVKKRTATATRARRAASGTGGPAGRVPAAVRELTGSTLQRLSA